MNTAKIDFACLCYVAEGPSSGYDIHRATRQGTLRLVLKASQAAIYEALRRLQSAGALHCQTVLQAGKPGKQLYDLTPVGHRTLPDYARKVTLTPADDATVLLLARFGRFVPPEAVASVVETYSNAIATDIEELSRQSGDDASGSSEMLNTMISVLDAKIRFAKAVSSAAASTVQR
ncbi:MAG: PadR family transcriptional regulator [Devosia sp.]